MLFSIYCIAHFVILNICDMETVDMFIDNSKYSQEIKKFPKKNTKTRLQGKFNQKGK